MLTFGLTAAPDDITDHPSNCENWNGECDQQPDRTKNTDREEASWVGTLGCVIDRRWFCIMRSLDLVATAGVSIRPASWPFIDWITVVVDVAGVVHGIEKSPTAGTAGLE